MTKNNNFIQTELIVKECEKTTAEVKEDLKSTTTKSMEELLNTEEKDQVKTKGNP